MLNCSVVGFSVQACTTFMPLPVALVEAGPAMYTNSVAENPPDGIATLPPFANAPAQIHSGSPCAVVKVINVRPPTTVTATAPDTVPCHAAAAQLLVALKPNPLLRF